MLAGFTHAPVVELSERLAALTRPGPRLLRQRRRLGDRDRLKMSAHYWRNAAAAARSGFVGLPGGYHGETWVHWR